MRPDQDPVLGPAVRRLVEEEVRRLAPGLPLVRFWHVAAEIELGQEVVPGESVLSRLGRQLERAVAVAGGGQYRGGHAPDPWLDGQLSALERELGYPPQTGPVDPPGDLRPGAAADGTGPSASIPPGFRPLWFLVGALAASATLLLSGICHF